VEDLEEQAGFEKGESKDEDQIRQIAEMFAREELEKDLKGDLQASIEGGSEPDPRFSSIGGRSYVDEFVDEGSSSQIDEEMDLEAIN